MRRLNFSTLVLAGCLCSLHGMVYAAGLTDLLMSRVGVTQPQAVGGTGAIFNYAKSQMTLENFAKLKSAVPGMDKYLAAAPPLGTPAVASAADATGAPGMGSLADKALSMTGGTALGGKAQAIQQLAPAFAKLGLKSKMIGKFVPVVTDYLQSAGGPSTVKLLTGALGF
ncbi:MAG: DUF2780 domain-containing protein [Gammaproteobacteria bacterium]|nr:DUF2780 domain-containing protein [Gammaproteobacteria bacterium]